MSNLTDALIAAKLVGGSGGSGGGSGLPEIRTETTYIVPLQAIPFADEGGGMYAGQVSVTHSISAGSDVKTSWDGVEYTNTVTDFSSMIVWGNLSMMGLPDTGEPFLGIYNVSQSGVGFYALTSQEASHTISVLGEAQNIPNDSMLIVDNGEWATKTKKQIFEDLIRIPATLDLNNHTVTYEGYTADEIAAMRQDTNTNIVLESDNPSVQLTYPVPYNNMAIGFNYGISQTSITLYIYVIAYDSCYRWEFTSSL